MAQERAQIAPQGAASVRKVSSVALVEPTGGGTPRWNCLMSVLYDVSDSLLAGFLIIIGWSTAWNVQSTGSGTAGSMYAPRALS